jgi:hypothetical protein
VDWSARDDVCVVAWRDVGVDHRDVRGVGFLKAPKGLVTSRAEGAAIGHGRLSLGALRLRELSRDATVRETTGPEAVNQLPCTRPR